MARILTWTLDNFNAGIHRTPAVVPENPTAYAADMENLRLTPEGHLVPRYGHTVEYNSTFTLQGIASVEREGEVLLFATDDQNRLLHLTGGGVAPLIQASGISGRLTAVLVDDDAIILTTEGDDRGYWIDLSALPTMSVYPLGFDKPDVSAVVTEDYTATGGQGSMDQDSYYYYRLTFFRNAPPFFGKQSVSSNIIIAKTTVGGGPPDTRRLRLTNLPTMTLASTGITSTRLWRTEGIITPLANGTATGGSDTTMTDTGSIFPGSINIGDFLINVPDRSQGIITGFFGNDTLECEDGFSGGTVNAFGAADDYHVVSATQPFHLLWTLVVGTPLFEDTRSDAELMTKQLFSLANNANYGLAPDGITALAYYNDRLFVACHDQSIRYSHVEQGDPLPWAFPPTNKLEPFVGTVHALVEMRGILVFGGASFLGRLSGTSIYNFEMDIVSRVTGPSDSYSWAKAKELLLFSAPDGLYTFDGIVPTRISLPIEKTERPIFSAGIVYLPTHEVLFSLFTSELFDESFLFDLDTGAWRKHKDIDTRQLAVGTIQGETHVFYVWRNTPYVRRFWHGIETAPISEGYPTEDETTGPTSPTTTPVVWRYKSQELFFSDTVKRFSFLEIQLAASETVTFDIWVDRTQVLTSTNTVPVDGSRPFRLPINRWGQRVQFQVSGNGPIEIQSLSIRAMTRR